MPDPTHTPPLGTPTTIAGVLAEVRHVGIQCDGRHQRGNAARAVMRETVVEHDRCLVELCGQSGRNGKVGHMVDRIDKVEGEQKSQRALIMKLVLIMASASATGAGVSHVVLNAL